MIMIISRTFGNENGNEIKIVVVNGESNPSPDNADVFFRIRGPESELTSRVTPKEAREFHKALGQALGI
jgi:hypothetical protein